MSYNQWMIKDFPDGQRQSLGFEQKPTISNISAENCMKMKEIGPSREGCTSVLLNY